MRHQEPSPVATARIAFARITGADFRIQPDDRDQSHLMRCVINRDKIHGPRVGDFVQFVDGTYGRLTHAYDDGMQTTVRDGTFGEGSHYLTDAGYISYSGALDPTIPKTQLALTDEVRPGRVWFFHHDCPCAHSAVYAEIPCRVYKEVAANG